MGSCRGGLSAFSLLESPAVHTCHVTSSQKLLTAKLRHKGLSVSVWKVCVCHANVLPTLWRGSRDWQYPLVSPPPWSRCKYLNNHWHRKVQCLQDMNHQSCATNFSDTTKWIDPKNLVQTITGIYKIWTFCNIPRLCWEFFMCLQCSLSLELTLLQREQKRNH